jgi:hypothetical protein
MSMVIRVVVGFLLVAHGLVHLVFISEDVTQFAFDGSWLLHDGGTAHSVGFALMAGSVGAFALAGASVWGVPGLARWWAALTIIAATLSLLLLAVFWQPDRVFGVTIDVVLLVVAVVQPGFTERLG